jgi:transcriptional regulator with XRE-family HTH domain
MTSKKNDIQISIGNHIKELREKKKLTQEELAEKSGLNRTFLIHIEKGRRNVSVKSLEKIFLGLGVSFSKFFKSEIF